MLAGALVLLGAALSTALDRDLARWVYVVGYFVGYVLLAFGFVLAMRARRGQ